MRVLLLAEIDDVTTMEDFQKRLDNFRESVLPESNYEITLSVATPQDIEELVNLQDELRNRQEMESL